MLDAVADTVAGEFVAKLIKKLRTGGRYGCFLDARRRVGNPPGIEVNALNGVPNTATLKRYAEAMTNGDFAIPIARVFPLASAAEGQHLAEGGAQGKVVLTP